MNDPTATPSPLSSEIFFLIGILVISGLVILLLRYYLPLRTTPAYLLIPIFFALVLPASLIILVPVDLASIPRENYKGEARGIWLPKGVILVLWRILYWETFFLTWSVSKIVNLLNVLIISQRFILPILSEYADAGYRDPKSRFLWSLKRNLVYQGVILGSGLAIMVYFFVSAGVSPITFKALLVATAYFWSLLFAIYLMGHGLVAIPRRFFRSANLDSRLEYQYAHATKVYEKLSDSNYELEDLETLVKELADRKTSFKKEFRDWIEELTEDIYLSETRSLNLSRRISNPDFSVPRILTEQYLANLSRSLSRTRHARAQYLGEWDRVVKSATQIKETLDAYSSGRIEIGKLSSDASLWKRIAILTPRTRFYYRYYFVPCLKKIIGLIFSIASFFIVWSELIKLINPLFSIITVTIVHHPNNENGEIGIAGQIIAASWIFYMCFAAMTSLTEVKVWRGRALVRRNTHGESAAWYSYQVARLSVPIAFNFMTFLDPEIYMRTVFYDFLGKLINLTPLSSWFDMLWPTFILIPVCATLFGLYSKIDNCIGCGELIVDEEDNDPARSSASWYSGRHLIERELHSPSTTRVARNPPKSREFAGTDSSEPSSTNLSRSDVVREQNICPDTQQTSQSSGKFFYNESLRHLQNAFNKIATPGWLRIARYSVITPQVVDENDQLLPSTGNSSRWFRGLGQEEGRIHIQ
ncbi:LMBR1 domain-containing protein 2 [Golovinomyces cichoracearum]|uniref:LMBR1 domain-containing protein 2 n=1 Tax=Golovinomyces cichoracearum TaxID=62708 RepID=A0A420J899_9PEZI|nr:LMBR1 domain-containing protein 2 [Golovinomyces cichoracearum]